MATQTPVPKPQLTPRAIFESYLKAIKLSEGSQLYQTLYLETPHGELTDILRGGELACANYVSAILYHFKYIQQPHATVEGTEKDLIESGWSQVTTPTIGDVIIWEPNFDHDPKAEHLHIGFSLGGDQAMSNSTTQKTIVQHHFTYGTNESGEPKRKIKVIFQKPTV